MTDDPNWFSGLPTPDAIDIAANAIEHAIRPHRAAMRRLATLEPLEAFALLGYLLSDTLNRFPADERRDIAAALFAELTDPDA